MKEKKTQIKVKALSAGQIKEFLQILARDIIPESELHWESPLDLVIAVVLSAQCTDKAVNKVTDVMFKKLRTPQDYLTAGEDQISEFIKSIGLFRNKTRSILGLCQRLQDEFNNTLPRSREELQTLPGVGPKTANVILNVLYKEPVMAVDTHIFRLANRCGFVKSKTPESTEEPLMKKIPASFRLHAHHYLILHGRYVCKARRPECWRCQVSHCCNYPDKNTQAVNA